MISDGSDQCRQCTSATPEVSQVRRLPFKKEYDFDLQDFSSGSRLLNGLLYVGQKLST